MRSSRDSSSRPAATQAEHDAVLLQMNGLTSMSYSILVLVGGDVDGAGCLAARHRAAQYVHRHEVLVHAHPHYPDLHHRH